MARAVLNSVLFSGNIFHRVTHNEPPKSGLDFQEVGVIRAVPPVSII